MTVSNICILGTIAVYLVGMLIIGFRCARKNESSADFYLGGRKLGPLVTAMSAEASDMSSYLLMGLPGLAYLSGVADVGWTAIGQVSQSEHISTGCSPRSDCADIPRRPARSLFRSSSPAASGMTKTFSRCSRRL